MTDAGYECLVENTKSSNLPRKVVQYEQFLNDILRSDLKYVKSLHSDNFHRSHQCQDTDGMNRHRLSRKCNNFPPRCADATG